MNQALSKKQVKRLASLSKLFLTETESEKFQKEFSSIIGYAKLIRGLRFGKTLPMARAVGIKNVFRKDTVKVNQIHTPKYFKTKKIL